MSAPPQPVKRACDACHRRKVRCTGGQPCRNCGTAKLQCTYDAIPQKKGPKGSRAKVISELRDIQQQTNPALKSPTSTPEDRGFDFNISPISPGYGRDVGPLLTQQTIETCLNFFFNHMYPTYPIFDHHRLRELAATQYETSKEVYCLTASLCAFIMVQPGMTLQGGWAENGDGIQSRYGTANAILDEVIRVRKTYDYAEVPSLMAVQTAFFLFACYFGLEKHSLAWFYGREASTLAHIADMHEESSYYMGDRIENIYRRRTYWLLLLTERAYAMERRRPLTLHATIDLPSTHEIPSDAAIIPGFLHLIALFRLIDEDFIGLWNKARSDCSTAWLAQLQQEIADALPPTLNSTESQAADIRVTQQWLRTMVWQLSIMNGYLSSSSTDSSMTFHYPVEIAKDLIRDINNLSLESMEVHGIGLIEKLFDVACTLTDVIALVPLETGAFGNFAADYLDQFLKLISQLRGGASRFLPLLLAKVSENLPSMAAPIHLMPLSVNEDENAASSISPSMSSQSAALVRLSPIPPFGPQTAAGPPTDPALMFSGYSPAASNGSGMTPTGTPHVVAPVPRSVPRIHFDGYMG